MSPDAVRAVCDRLHALGEPLFALLDAARHPAVLAALQASDQPFQSLYEGAEADTIADYGPFLVSLDGNRGFLARLVEQGWGRSWGVYLTSPADLATIRHHLRRYLKVEIPTGQTALFRFYDPRVLREFFPLWSPAEQEAFLGPVACYAIEDATGGVSCHGVRPVALTDVHSGRSR